MDDFYKQFKENLENREAPPIEKELWEKLKRDLDQQDKVTPKAVISKWWSAAGMLLLLLLGANLYGILEMKKINTQIAKVERTVDTVYQTKIIYQTDTIVKTNIKEKTVIRYISSAFASSFTSSTTLDIAPLLKGRTIDNSNTDLFYNQTPSTTLLLAEYLYGEPLKNKTTTGGKIAPTNTKKTTISFSDLPAIVNLDIPLILTNRFLEQSLNSSIPMVNAQKKTRSQPLYAMRPKGIKLGIDGGWASPRGKNISPNNSSVTGIEAAVLFSDNLQLWAAAHYATLHFESEVFDDSNGIPVVTPPSDAFEFQQANVDQPTLQYSLGMQYNFNTQRKWRPFVGLGMAAVKILPYEVDYEFEIPDQEIKWENDREIAVDELKANFVLLKGGVSYQLRDHWNVQLQTFYRANWKKEGLQPPNLLGIQSGLSYTF